MAKGVTKINGKTWKKVSAGSDWSDPDTWKGLAVVLVIVGSFLTAHLMGWIKGDYYNYSSKYKIEETER